MQQNPPAGAGGLMVFSVHKLKLSPKSRSIRIRNTRKISLFFLPNPPDIKCPSFPERIASFYAVPKGGFYIATNLIKGKKFHPQQKLELFGPHNIPSGHYAGFGKK